MPVFNNTGNMKFGAQQVLRAVHRGATVWSPAVKPTNTSPPIVTGAVVVGDTAATTNGTWAGTLPMSFEYKWQFDDDGVWTDIPAEDLATYLTTFAGELRSGVLPSNVAGPADDWAYSAPFIVSETAALAVFADANEYLALTEGGRRATYTGSPGAGIGNCFSSAPIVEPTYLVARLTSSSTAGAAGLQFYNGTETVPLTYGPFGNWYAQPGLTIMLAPTWVLAFFGCDSLPEAVGTTVLEGLATGFVDAPAVVFPNGRIWLWSRDMGGGAGGWYGGGDPNTDTTPTIILPGTGPMRFGAASNHADASVFLLDPADYPSAPYVSPSIRRGVLA